MFDEPEQIPPNRPSMIGRLRTLAVDLSPLRESRQFRLLFIGETVSDLGSEITAVAVPFQVYQLTLSPLAVGLLIGTIGLGGTYLVDVGSFLAALVTLSMMRPIPKVKEGVRGQPGVHRGGPPVPARKARVAIDVHGRPQRDDLRHAAGAVSGV